MLHRQTHVSSTLSNDLKANKVNQNQPVTHKPYLGSVASNSSWYTTQKSLSFLLPYLYFLVDLGHLRLLPSRTEQSNARLKF